MFRYALFAWSRRRALIAAVLLACGLPAGEAAAQWIVKDPAAIMAMVEEYAQTAQRWKAQWEHYQQQRIPLQQLRFRDAEFVDTEFVDTFPERTPGYGMDTSCPGQGSQPAEIGGAFAQTPPAMTGSLIDEQRSLCQRIVAAENQRYNETVRMLKRMVRQQRDFIAGIEAQRAAVGTSEGALAANDNEVERFATRTDMALDYWQARMRAYDAYIASLEKDQSRLTRRALGGQRDGGNPIAGQLVQAAALKTALSP